MPLNELACPLYDGVRIVVADLLVYLRPMSDDAFVKHNVGVRGTGCIF